MALSLPRVCIYHHFGDHCSKEKVCTPTARSPQIILVPVLAEDWIPKTSVKSLISQQLSSDFSHVFVTCSQRSCSGLNICVPPLKFIWWDSNPNGIGRSRSGLKGAVRHLRNGIRLWNMTLVKASGLGLEPWTMWDVRGLFACLVLFMGRSRSGSQQGNLPLFYRMPISDDPSASPPLITPRSQGGDMVRPTR